MSISDNIKICVDRYMQTVKHLKDKVNDEELKLISELLHSCSQLEKEYARRKEPGTITEMFDAAGRFQSLSILYSV